MATRFHHDTACRQAALRSQNTWVSSFGATFGAAPQYETLPLAPLMRQVDVDMVVMADAALAHRVPRGDAAVAVAVPAAVGEQDLLDAELAGVGVDVALGVAGEQPVDDGNARVTCCSRRRPCRP